MDEQSAAKLQKRSGGRQKALDQCKSSIDTAEVGTSSAATPQCAPRLYREHCLSECTSLSRSGNAERARRCDYTYRVRQALARNARARLHAWRSRAAAGPSACKSAWQSSSCYWSSRRGSRCSTRRRYRSRRPSRASCSVTSRRHRRRIASWMVLGSSRRGDGTRSPCTNYQTV